MTPQDIQATTEALARQLAASAVARDQAGGHAAAERQALRDSGLLRLSVPRALGGLGADWPTVYGVVEQLARVDSALAHVFAFHHLQVATLLIYGRAEQQDRLLGLTLSDGLFWGNALNPRDQQLLAQPVPGGWQLDGVKSYCSGSVGSDWLTLSAHVAGATPDAPLQLLLGALPTRSPGLQVQQDWDAFGQRQTDSGTVRFEAVFLPERDVLSAPGSPPTVRHTVRAQLAQLVLTHLYLGIAQGAFDTARSFIQGGRPWPAAQVASVLDDPYVQHRFGELRLLLRPARMATEAAVAHLQRTLELGEAVTAAQRGALAVDVAEAKVLAHRAAIEISSQLFELTGARATSARFGLDRFWRNARVHTLHDPVDYKLRDIGRHALDGRPPEPSPYS